MIDEKTFREEFLKSNVGNILFDYITGIYDNCRVMVEIYEALGVQFDRVEFMFDDILRQMFPQTATWGIELWEQRLKLPTNENEGIETRRGKVIAKLQSRVTINPETMASITKNLTDVDIKIVEWIKEWTFLVQADAEYMRKGQEIYKIIKRIKPSHMAFILQFVLLQEHYIYFGACTYLGFVHTILPYDLSPIEIEVNTYSGSTTTHIVKRVSIE